MDGFGVLLETLGLSQVGQEKVTRIVVRILDGHKCIDKNEVMEAVKEWLLSLYFRLFISSINSTPTNKSKIKITSIKGMTLVPPSPSYFNSPKSLHPEG